MYQIHYLDDFLFLEAPDTDEGERSLDIALRMLELLGVPVATHKTEGPSTLVTFIGILIDTVSFELRLPDEKIQRLRALLERWQSKRSCRRKELKLLWGTYPMQPPLSDLGAPFSDSSSACFMWQRNQNILFASTLEPGQTSPGGAVSCSLGMGHPSFRSLTLTHKCTLMPQATLVVELSQTTDGSKSGGQSIGTILTLQ